MHTKTIKRALKGYNGVLGKGEQGEDKCWVKMLPQVHGAGCSQQRQVRVVSTGTLLSNTKTNPWLNLGQANSGLSEAKIEKLIK